MEEACSAKVFVPVYQATWHCIPEVSYFEYILKSSNLLKNNFAQQSHSKTYFVIYHVGFVLFLQGMSRWPCYITNIIYSWGAFYITDIYWYADLGSLLLHLLQNSCLDYFCVYHHVSVGTNIPLLHCSCVLTLN
jgi:hypothetical protein